MESQDVSWRTSSYSENGGGNCVEAAASRDGAVLVRDTKDHGHGQVHTFTADQWRAFVVSVKARLSDSEAPAHAWCAGAST
jgi:hypothetical protein